MISIRSFTRHQDFHLKVPHTIRIFIKTFIVMAILKVYSNNISFSTFFSIIAWIGKSKFKIHEIIKQIFVSRFKVRHFKNLFYVIKYGTSNIYFAF